MNEVVIVWNGEQSEELEFAIGSICDAAEDKFNIPIQLICEYYSDVYRMYNLGVDAATSHNVLLLNDDMYFPPNWDWNIEEDGCVITFKLVEPGYVDVNNACVKNNFGMTIPEFDKDKFDKYAQSYQFDSKMELGKLGWYMPVIFPKSLFNKVGQYPTFPPFPYPNDIAFFDTLRQDSATKFIQYNSAIYHFQRLSQRQDKLNLCCGNDKQEGYLNVDKEDFDLSEGKIPYEDEKFDEVLFKHALEHFRRPLAAIILSEIYRILNPDGFLDILVPDVFKACADLMAGYNHDENCAPAIERIYGLSTCEEQVHKWGYSEETLSLALADAGFTTLSVMTPKHADEIWIRAWKKN